MKKLLFLLFFVSLAFMINSQCDAANFTVTPNGGTCFSNASIDVQIPGASTCAGWTAILTRPDLSETSLAIPLNGGPISFTGLPAGNYSIRLFNGITTHQFGGNPFALSTTYVNMSITNSRTIPSCPNASAGYVPDATLTINKVSGGIGPFMYSVTSSLGTQTFGPTTNVSHTFSGLPSPETVTLTVTDSAGGTPGCAVTITQTPLLNANTTTHARYRSSVLRKNCSPNCTSYTALFRMQINNASEFASLNTPGNATITINNGAPQNLVLSGSDFSYPNAFPGDTADLYFNSGCRVFTVREIIPALNNTISITTTNTFNSATCLPNYRVRFGQQQGNFPPKGYQWSYFYPVVCPTHELMIEKDSSGIWINIPLSNTTPNPLNTWVSPYYNLPDSGSYRVIISDDCDTIIRLFNLAAPPPPSAITIASLNESTSVLEGTSSLRVNATGGVAPYQYEVRPIPFVDSVIINPTGPGHLAKSYTIHFPINFSISGAATVSALPPGTYEVNVIGDNCSNPGPIDTITLVNAAQYSSVITPVQGCANSNSINFDMNPNSGIRDAHWQTLLRQNNSGVSGPIVKYGPTGSLPLQGSFNNVSSGSYFLNFTGIYPQSPWGQVSAVGLTNWSYRIPVTVLPYQDITVAANVFKCDDTTGVISTDIIGGTPIYPMAYTLYDAGDLVTPLQTDTAFSSADTIALSKVFDSVANGNYVVRVWYQCYSVDVNITVDNSFAPPQIVANDTTVCPMNSATTLALPISLVYWDIVWKDTMGNVIDTNVTLINVSPIATNKYIAEFQLKDNLGCLTTPIYRDTAIIEVTPNPVLGLTVSDVDYCLTAPPYSITISNTDTNHIYELIDSNGLSHNSPIIDTGNGGVLTIAIPDSILPCAGRKYPIFVSNIENSGCSGYLTDSVHFFSSTLNINLSLQGDTICEGFNAQITLINPDSGAIYEVYENGLPLAPTVFDTATNTNLVLTIPATQLNIGVTNYHIQTSSANCIGGFLIDSATVIVYDTIAPNFVANDTTIRVACLSDLPALPDSNIIDSVGLISITSSIQLINTICVNEFTRIAQYYAIDSCGLTDTMTQTVIVKDSIAPIITCNDTTVYLNALGQVTIDTSYVFNSATDNCGVDSIWITTNTFNCSNIGPQTIQVYVKDVCNNLDSCSSIVTIVDTLNPIVGCNDTAIYLDATGQYIIDTSYIYVNATDNCGIDSIWTNDTLFNCSNIGTNTATLYARDVNGNIDSCIANVTVLDNLNPILTCNDTTVYLSSAGTYSIDTSYVFTNVTDNCGVDSVWIQTTNYTCSDTGINTTTVYARDVNNNIDSCIATVTVLDTVPPMIGCNDTTIYLPQSGIYIIDSSYIYSTSFSGCGLANIWTNDTLYNCSNIGVNTATLYATDVNSNIDSCIAIVTVLDTLNPIIGCNDTTVYLDATGQYTIDTSYILTNATDNCGIDSIWTNDTLFTCTSTGINIATIYARDVNGNTDSCIATVTVLDTILPIVTCKDTTIYLNASGQYSIDTGYMHVSNNDNCAVDSIWTNDTLYDCSNIGTNQATIYVRDVSGNINSCIATVTVLDTVAPQIVCRDTTIYLNNIGQITIDTSFVVSSINENCTLDTAWLSNTIFTCLDSGQNTVTIYVRDLSGNIDSCQSAVTVLDSIPPIPTCTNLTIYLDTNGQASITVSDIDGGSSDNCAIVSTTIDINTFDCEDIGVNMVTLTVTDNYSNQNTCIAQVTVLDTVTPIISCGTTLYDTVSNSCEYTIPDFTGLSILRDNCTDSINLQITQTPLIGSVISIQDQLTQNIVITVTDTNGNQSVCMFDVELTCEDEIQIPEFISPNGDGKNDRWIITGIDSYPNNSVKVFNRHGALVYESKGYQNTWGGTANVDYIFQAGKTDNILPSGTYFYRLELDTQNQNSEVHTGIIQIQK